MHILVSFSVLSSASSWFSFSLGRLSTAWTVFSSLSTSWTNSEVRLSSIRVMFWVTFVGRKNMALTPSVRGSWAICKARNKREIRKGHINNHSFTHPVPGLILRLESQPFEWTFDLFPCLLLSDMMLPDTSGFFPRLSSILAALFLLWKCSTLLNPAALLWGILTGTPLSSCSRERLVERGTDRKVLKGVPCPSCPTLSQAIQAGRTWA